MWTVHSPSCTARPTKPGTRSGASPMTPSAAHHAGEAPQQGWGRRPRCGRRLQRRGAGAGGGAGGGGGGGGNRGRAGRYFSASEPTRGRREFFPATCAACGCETTVPFRPIEGRPVYCRDCFQGQKLLVRGTVTSAHTEAGRRGSVWLDRLSLRGTGDIPPITHGYSLPAALRCGFGECCAVAAFGEVRALR